MIARKIGYIGYIVECQWFSWQHFGNTKSNKSYINVTGLFRFSRDVGISDDAHADCFSFRERRSITSFQLKTVAFSWKTRRFLVNESEFAREDILQTNFQFHEDRFKLIQSQMVLAVLNAEKGLMRNATLFREFGIGKVAARFS